MATNLAPTSPGLRCFWILLIAHLASQLWGAPKHKRTAPLPVPEQQTKSKSPLASQVPLQPRAKASGGATRAPNSPNATGSVGAQGKNQDGPGSNAQQQPAACEHSVPLEALFTTPEEFAPQWTSKDGMVFLRRTPGSPLQLFHRSHPGESGKALHAFPHGVHHFKFAGFDEAIAVVTQPDPDTRQVSLYVVKNEKAHAIDQAEAISTVHWLERSKRFLWTAFDRARRHTLLKSYGPESSKVETLATLDASHTLLDVSPNEKLLVFAQGAEPSVPTQWVLWDLSTRSIQGTRRISGGAFVALLSEHSSAVLLSTEHGKTTRLTVSSIPSGPSRQFSATHDDVLAFATDVHDRWLYYASGTPLGFSLQGWTLSVGAQKKNPLPIRTHDGTITSPFFVAAENGHVFFSSSQPTHPSQIEQWTGEALIPWTPLAFDAAQAQCLSQPVAWQSDELGRGFFFPSHAPIKTAVVLLTEQSPSTEFRPAAQYLTRLGHSVLVLQRPERWESEFTRQIVDRVQPKLGSLLPITVVTSRPLAAAPTGLAVVLMDDPSSLAGWRKLALKLETTPRIPARMSEQ